MSVNTKIFVVTPCFNAVEHLESALTSVVSQSGDFSIHHHVQDGGSSDGTLAVLERWSQLNAYGLLPRAQPNYSFSFVSEPDEGMYDAIAKAFLNCPAAPDDWLGWINADDILMPGAASTLAAINRDLHSSNVHWVGGRVRVQRNEVIVADYDSFHSSALIGEGLCDGLHYDFVQQEGIFFRRCLWDRIDPDRDFSAFSAAGDWNLWRNFAKHTQFYQTAWAMGEFRHRAGQKSEDKQAYYLEIERVVPFDARTKALGGLQTAGATRQRLQASWIDSALSIETQSATQAISNWCNQPQKIAARQRFIDVSLPAIQSAALEPAGLRRHSSRGVSSTQPSIKPVPHIVAHEADWQFPAITEKHALYCVRKFLPNIDGVAYLGFPWATLIDHMNGKTGRADELKDRLEALVAELGSAQAVVTVCQHIHLDRLIEVMSGAGVTDVFFPHAVRGSTSPEVRAGIRIHPFPLYPVQYQNLASGFDEQNRRYLFSFVGARADKWYLTDVRNVILDELAQHPLGYIRGRDKWHYERVVYQHQIHGREPDPEPCIERDASEEFRQILEASTFSLCPSGSGPNSIRLWESIAAGAVPVVLADTWLPPGDMNLWKAAVVFCEETADAVRALPERLQQLAADKEAMSAHRQAMRQLWMLYGPDSFVTDIHKFYARLATRESVASASFARNGSQVSTAGPALSNEPITPGADRTAIAGPPVHGIGKPRLKICLYGRHAHRTPLSYGPYREFAWAHLEYVDRPEVADVLIVGFDLDLRDNAAEISRLYKANPDLKLVVLSEEPLWDTVWSAGYRSLSMEIILEGQPIPITVLNHFTSKIFDFDHVPYFITTSDEFVVRYSTQLTRHQDLSAEALLKIWHNAPIRAAFYAEKRDGPKYDIDVPDLSLRGLSAYRSHLAQSVSGPGISRMGKGWNTAQARQDLPDWHLDKLAALERRARIVSGVENTHTSNYVTEKIFDAFASCAIPVYYAAPGHRVFDLVGPEAMINCFDRSPADAASLIMTFEPDREFAQAYLENMSKLAARFRDLKAVVRERQRVFDAVLSELLVISQ